MDKQSVENMDEWFTLPVYDCMRVLGLESKGHLTQLQYLPLTNTIAGVTNEDCIVTFDASSGEPLQSFKIGKLHMISVCRLERLKYRTWQIY